LSGRSGFDDRIAYLRAAADWGADAVLAPLRVGVTVFPMLGFLGTVIGLSAAIAELPSAVKDNTKLQPVLDSLYVAFDTTFLGLIGALACILFVRVTEPHVDALGRAVPR
jgi:biopolymer transport protein ExbB/TolQ